MEVRAVKVSEKSLLQKILRDYLAELGSADPDGYPYFELYWQKIDRFAYFISDAENLVGFALVNRVSALGRQNVHSIAEFYIMPQYRRQGFGRLAAQKIISYKPGYWEILYAASNEPAKHFWPHAVSSITNRQVNSTDLINPHRIVLSFLVG